MRVCGVFNIQETRSFSAINNTTVKATIAEGTDATKAADKAEYTVKVGETAVAVTAVAYDATTRIATLTVNLAGLAGKVSVNGVETATAIDHKLPTLTKVEASNNKTIFVTYSEKVDSAAGPGANSALNPANYILYNETTGVGTELEAAGVNTATKIGVTLAFTDTTNKAVKLTINNVGANVAGYPMGGLSNGNFILYVSNVKDVAGNQIITASNYPFQGTLTPDSEGAHVTSAIFNSGNGEVTLNFDKAVNKTVPVDDKVYFQAGTNKVNLKAAADYTLGAGAWDNSKVTTLTFKVNDTPVTGTLAKINALGANLQLVLAAGAFTDGANPIAEQTVTPTIGTTPMLTAVTYDENTNTAVFKFSKTINVAAITTFVGNFKIGNTDIYGGAANGATFKNTANSTDLEFKLADASAQAVELAVRGGTLTATVVAGTVKDTETPANANAGATSAVALEVGTTYIKDTTAPSLTAAKYNGDTGVLELTFNESVRNTIGDFVVASVQIYKDDNGVAGLQTAAAGGVVADTQVTTFATDNVVQTELVKDATGGAQATVGSEKSTIFVSNAALKGKLNAVAAATDIYVNMLAGGVKDANTNATTAVQSVKVTKVAVSNTSSITADTALTANNNGSIKVEFMNAPGNPVAMDPATAGDKSKYDFYLKANPLNKVEIESVVMNATNTEATLLLKAPLAASTVYCLTTSGIKTASGAAGDIDGTTILPEEVTSKAGPDTTVLTAVAPLVLTDKDSSGTVSAGDTIAITFNEEVRLPATFAISDLTVANGHLLGASTFALSADKKTFTITVGAGATIAVGDTISFPTTIKDLEGNALADGNKTTNVMTVKGNVNPKIKLAVYTDTNADGVVSTGDTLVVTFDQNVKIPTGKTAADVLDDIVVNGATFTAATVSEDKVTLTIGTPGTLAVGVNADVAGGADAIANSWGTLAVATAKAITASDTVAPTVTGISYKGGTIHALTFTFSEAVNDNTKSVDADSLAAALAADLTANGGALGAGFTAATLSADKKSVTITLDGNEAIDEFVTITIAAGTFGDATDNIQDASGNIAVRGQGTPYAITIVQ